MKNDLLEKVCGVDLCLLSLGPLSATYGISAESRKLIKFKTVAIGIGILLIFLALPVFIVVAKKIGILSQSGKVFQGQKETNFS